MPARRRPGCTLPCVDLAEFDYTLPPEAIAQAPPASREDARLLVIDRAHGTLTDRRVAELPDDPPSRATVSS